MSGAVGDMSTTVADPDFELRGRGGGQFFEVLKQN